MAKPDGSIDKDALMKHLDDSMKDAAWKTVMKGAGEECYKEISTKKDEIVNELEKAPFNIKKDQCNVQFMSMVTCIHLEGFVVSNSKFSSANKIIILIFLTFPKKCPKDSWTDNKNCNDAKAWIDKCGDNIDSMKQLVAKKSAK